MAGDPAKNQLLRREADFWNRQEEKIDSLYARPHDWRFAPEIADRIVYPKISFMFSLFRRHGADIRSLLDIGCGNGWFCHFAARSGLEAHGVDLSDKKIDTARRLATESGLTEKCHFYAGDAETLELPHKVDLLTAHGSLHHFPDLEEVLPKLIERHLRPGGYMLFIEPHHEGMPEGLARFLIRLANRPKLGRIFDKEFYLEVSGKKELVGEAPRDENNIRGESPAGLEFLGEEPDMGEILKSRFHLLEERYFFYLIGHCSNAFYIYMKPAWLKRFFRLTLPLWIVLDNTLCRFRRFQKHAEEGAWFLKTKG